MNPNGPVFDTATAWGRVQAQSAERKARRIQTRSTWEPDFGAGAPGAVPPVFLEGLNHNQRRAYLREQAKRKPRVEGPVITEAMIPPGSLLSDETLERIRAGEMRLTRMPVGSVAPQHREQRRARHRMERASRKRNRGR